MFLDNAQILLELTIPVVFQVAIVEMMALFQKLQMRRMRRTYTNNY
jgi:hypothetical protein